jgi:hypothetical protein
MPAFPGSSIVLIIVCGEIVRVQVEISVCAADGTCANLIRRSL